MKKYKKYLLLIFLIGTFAYLPIFFNSFVWDDYAFILNDFQIHELNIPILLGQNLFNVGPFYRPIPAIYFATLYSFFGHAAFFYHVLQLILHLTDSFLLFLFCCNFFSEDVSIFLTLLFLIHPMNVESVAYIGASDSELFFLPGMAALLLSWKRNISVKRLFGIGLLLLLSVLAKETGLLFIVMAILLRYFFGLGKVKQFLLLSLLIFLLYIFFRVVVGGVTFGLLSPYIPIAQLPLTERLISIPAIILYYLKTFIFPFQLLVSQEWVISTFASIGFVLPFLLCIFILLFFFGIIAFFFKREQTGHKTNLKILYFFTLWFCLGLGMLLQIVPLDMTVADRWFYFPMVGILGIVGVGLEGLFHVPKLKRYGYIFYTIAVVIICLFSIRTFFRTIHWQNNMTLFADAKNESNNSLLNDEYALILYENGQTDEAIFYGYRSVSISPTLANEYHLGVYYTQDKQYQKAIKAYTYAISLYKPILIRNITNKTLRLQEDDILERMYNDLAVVYIIAHQPQKAVALITTKALHKFPSDASLYINLAIADMDRHNYQQALVAIAKANQLNPNANTGELYRRIKNNLPISVDLD